MTNYERIKEMSVEEMAEFLLGDCDRCKQDSQYCLYNRYPDELPCKAGALEWLNSEVENGNV